MARPGLDRHPKFRTLCRLLGEPRPHVLGYLEMIWATAYESGNPFIGDSLMVESCAEFPGEAGRLTTALLTCGGEGRPGFIEPAPGREGCYQVHDLFHHAPKYVSHRFERERQRATDKTCAHCGGVYQNADPRSKYCSPSCRTLHSRPKVDGKLTEVDGSCVQSCGLLTDVDTTPNSQHPAPNGGMNSPTPPSLPAEAGEVKKARKPRKRDPLFDALAEITGSDPQASGSYLGRVCKALRSADPPYTPDELRHLPSALARYGLTVPVTLGVVEKYVGWLRHPPANSRSPGGESDPDGESPTGPKSVEWAQQFEPDPEGKP